MSSEFHGIFQFQDELFDSEPRKQRHFADTEFSPVDAFPGWFLGSLDTFSAKFNDKLGSCEIIQSIEYKYHQGNYVDCLAICLKWLQASDQRASQIGKPAKQNYILEIASRCCLKLSDIPMAEKLVDKMTVSREAGLIFTKATVYSTAGRYWGNIDFI